MTAPQAHTVLLRLAAFTEWLDNADHGDVLIYHKGYLVVDRGDVTGDHPVEPYHSIALAAMQAKRNGLVLLTQRKRAPYAYDYIATRTRRKHYA